MVKKSEKAGSRIKKLASIEKISQIFRGKPDSNTPVLEFQVEDCEERMMLAADELVFRADFEDADVAPGNYGFFTEVSGMTASGVWVEIQNNYPGIGPAAQGQKHVELDGGNGLFVDLNEGDSSSLSVKFFYSARPGVSVARNAVEVYWQGNLVTTVADDGANLERTNFREVTLELEGGGNGRLEFKSNRPKDNVGLGGLIDDIRVTKEYTPPQIIQIRNQRMMEGETLNIKADLIPPNTGAEGLTYRLINSPTGMEIDESTGEITWVASRENIDAANASNGRFQVGKRQMQFRSRFEDIPMPNGQSRLATEISGFEVTGDPVEVQRNVPGVGMSDDGVRHVKLDRDVGIFRNVDTVPGDRYQMVIAFSPHPGVPAPGNAIEILWDGEVVRSISRSGVGLTTTDYRDYIVNLPVVDGDLTRLEIRSRAFNDPVGFGGLIDNVRMFRRPVTYIEGNDGDFDVLIEVVDDCGKKDRERFRVLIEEDQNGPPMIEPISDQMVDEGQTFEYSVEASDPDGDQLTYSLDGETHGATIDPNTGLFSFSTSEESGPGVFEFAVKVADPDGLSDRVTFEIEVKEVNLAPSLNALPDLRIQEGAGIDVTAVASDPDIPANDLTFSLDSAPTGASIHPQTGQIQWTSTDSGEETFVVRVADAAGLFATRTFKVTVVDDTCLFDPNDVMVSQMGGVGQGAGSVTINGCDYLLAEGNSFEVSASVKFVVPDAPSSFVFEYSALNFDFTDPDRINDAFEVAVVDNEGNSLVHTTRDGNDSFFNVSEPDSKAAGINTVVDGNRISIDLKHITAGTEATLIFRLVNNDSDTQTSVIVTPIEFGEGLDTPSGRVFDTVTSESQDSSVDLASLQNVTGSFQTHYGLTTFTEKTQALFAEVSFENLANHPIDGPIVLVISNISDPNVIPLDPDGIDADGNRFYLLMPAIGESIEPGESTNTLSLPFLNPNGNQFDYSIDLFGVPNTAPEFVSDPATEGTVGLQFNYDSEAVDPDNDPLTYKLMAGPTGLTIDPSSGLLEWTPGSQDEGMHSVIIETSDGRGGRDQQQFEIEVLSERPNRPPVIISTPVTEAFLVPPSDTASETDLQFIELTPEDVGSASPTVFSTLPTVDSSIFGIDGDVRFVNFDEDPFGNAIASGTYLNIEYESIGITLNNVLVSNSVYGGPASPPNTTFTPAIQGEGLVFQFAVPVQAVGFINTSPDQDLVEFFDSDGELIFSMRDQDGLPKNFNVDRFIGAIADPDRPIASMRVSNNSGNLELDELVFVPIDSTYEYNSQAIDPDEDPIAYQLDEAPQGMIINSKTGKISWLPNANQIGTHQVVLTAKDGRGGQATQEFQVRVLADPTNAAPVIISDPVDDFFVPGFSNPASGDVSPQRIALDLGNGETFEGTVSITLDEDAARYADIVLAVDESASMGGDQDWVAEMIPLLDDALIAAGIGNKAAFPNRFAVIGFGGGRDGITVGHFLNSEKKTNYILYGPDNEIVATGELNDVVPDELLNLTLPQNGQYILVVEPQESPDLTQGINIGFEANLGEGVRTETLELNSQTGGVLLPGQPVEYHFSKTTPGLVYFDSLAKDGRLTWKLESKSGTVISGEKLFNRALSSNGFLVDLAADEYVLKIDSNSDVAADYLFELIDLSAVRQLSSGDFVQDDFALKAETFAYRFDVEAGKEFKLVNTTTGVHTGSRWRLIDEDGNLISSGQIGVNPNPLRINQTGEYYLLMESELSPFEGVSQLRTESRFTFTLEILDPAPPIELVLDDTFDGIVEFQGQLFDYEFTLDSRSLIYFDSHSNNRMRWNLTGPKGDVVVNRFLDSGSPYANGSHVLDLVAGTYRLNIDGNGLVGPYQFRMMDLDSAMSITPGTAVDGTLSPSNSSNLYQFDAAAGESFFFDVEAAEDASNIRVIVIDPYGQIVTQNILVDIGEISVPADGTYTLIIEGDSDNIVEDDYRINLVPIVETVSAMTLGALVSGSLATPGAKAKYTFTLDEHGLLYLDSLTSNSDFRYALTGPRGTEFTNLSFTNTDSYEGPTPTLEAVAGDYVLTVMSATDGVGDFSFRATDLLGAGQTEEVTPNPGPANPSVNIDGNITSNESVLFSFDAAAGDVVSFVPTASNFANVSYRLFDKYGRAVFNNTGLSSNRSEQELPVDGTYLLMVEGRHFNDIAMSFDIDINWLRNDGGPSFGGNPLNFNETTSGEFTTDGQVDSYVFTADENTRAYFDSLTNSSSIRWRLTSPKGLIINNIAFTNSDSFNNSRPVFQLVPGDYQLDIYSNSNSYRGEYGFRLVDLASAQMITPGVSFAGDLTPANETDMYQLDVVAGERIYVDVKAFSDRNNTQLKLVDPFGRIAAVVNNLSDIEQVAEYSGTYTLLVEGWRGNTGLDTYQIAIHKAPTDTVAILLEEKISGVLETPGQMIEHTFTLNERTLVDFDSLTADSSLNWSLSGPSGLIVSSLRFDLSDGIYNAFQELDLPAGDYTLTVDGALDRTGEFEFVLRDIANAISINPAQVTSGQVNVNEGTTAEWVPGVPALSAPGFGAVNLKPTSTVELPSTSLNGLSDFTIEFWYKTSESRSQSILSGANQIDGQVIQFGLVSDIQFGMTDVGTWDISSVADGNWHHYAIVHEDGVGTEFLLDGISQGTINQSIGELAVDPGGLFVGKWQSVFGGGFRTDNSMNGQFDELRIWSSIRTESEIDSNRNSVVDGSTAGLTGYWRFDETSGNDVSDETPTGNNATYTPLSKSNATRIYQFESQEGDQFFFNAISHQNFASSPYWRLVDSYGQRIFNQGFGSDFGPIVLGEGTHTIFVEGQAVDVGLAGQFEFEIIPLGNIINPEPAEPLEFDQIVDSDISVLFETDRYSFSLSDTTLAYFDSLTNDNNVNWSLSRNGSEIVSARQFARSDSTGFTQPVMTLRPGDYELSVTSTTVRPYSFRLLNLSDATMVEMDAPFAGTLDIGNETKLYKFDAEPGQMVFTNVVSVSASTAASLRLFDEQGRVLAYSPNVIDMENVSLPGGTYFLAVAGKPSNSTPIDFQIDLVASASTLTTLSLGEVTSGEILNPGDEIAYEFALDTDSQLYFDSLTDSATLGWSLAGPVGEVVSQRLFSKSDSFNISDPVLRLTPGNYQLTVAGIGDATGPFEFNLFDLNTSMMIEIGDLIGGAGSEVSNQTLTYQFEAAAGSNLLVDVQSTNDDDNTLYRIYDRDWNKIAEQRSLNDRDQIEIDRTGIYTLLIEGWRGNTEADLFEIILQQETTRDAGTISLNTPIIESIAAPAERIRFNFNLAQDGLIHFDTQTNNANMTWMVTGPRGEEFDLRLNQVPTDPAQEWVAGDYTITIDGIGDETGSLQFAVLDLSDDSHSELVDPKLTGSTVISSIQPHPGGTEAFRFEAVAGDLFSFEVDPGVNPFSDYRLVDPYGRRVFTRFISQNQPTVEVELTGTYFLLVEGRLTNTLPDEYSITINHEGNNPQQPFNGTTINFGQIVNGDLDTAGQVDSYILELTEDTQFYMDVFNNNSNFRWRLNGPRGIEVDNLAFNRTDAFGTSSPVRLIPAGTYQLDIYAGSGSPGTYSFKAENLADATSITPGTEFTGELTTPNETDLFKFDANQGEKLFFDVVEASDISGAEFKVIDPFGRTFLESSGLRDLDVVAIPHDGTYTLLVEGALNNSGTDTYKFNVVPFSESVELLELGKATSASNQSPGSQSVYTFNLAEDAIFFFGPGSDDDQFQWSLNDGEIDIVSDRSFDDGNGFYLLRAGDYELRIDSLGDSVGDISFTTLLADSTESLATDGTKTFSSLDSDNQKQIYRFNGSVGQHFALLPDFGMQFTQASQAATTAENYIASAQPEDGYSGIQMALRADAFREGAAINYILVTDEDRDVHEDDVTFEGLFRALTNQSALLNVVTTSQFRDDTNTRAIGVDHEGNAYIADGNGGFTVGTGGFTTQTNVSFKQDYIDLGWALDGANWDLSLLRSGGTNAESFTNAFVDVKVEEILEQTSLRLISADPTADFEVTSPTDGVYSEIEGGRKYDFEITVGNNGKAKSYDLLFQQGQVVGSIPVFIVAPYEYGAAAVDPDGDKLQWSIVEGPEGLQIDSESGYLIWTGDYISYGEHDVTIRVEDGRGGFDEQTFTLNVNGGEESSIGGRVVDQNSVTEETTGAIVSGRDDPYLSGMPDGSTASSGDYAPEHSPTLVEGFLTGLIPGTTMTFAATGAVNNVNAPPPADQTPDGAVLSRWYHANGAENGISNFGGPINALMGVFLTDDRPDLAEAPELLDFTIGGNVPGGVNYTSLAPKLQQLFFIGDGLADDGTVQEVTIPEGATRLFLGTFDAYGWYDNFGQIEVEVTAIQYSAPEDSTFTVFIDENRNGLLDDNERSTSTNEDGDFNFEGLQAGTYTIVQQPLAGWELVSPEARSFEITIDPGQAVSDLVFVNTDKPLTNTDPKFLSDPPAHVVAGEDLEYLPLIEELDGDELMFDLPLSPNGMVINPDNGKIVWQPRLDQVGTQSIVLRVRDGFGGYDLQFFQVEVEAPNSAPVITSNAPTGPAGVGLPYQYLATAVDADGDSFTWSLGSAPDGMSIDPVTGEINWTPTLSQVGDQEVNVIVTDDRGGETIQTYEIAVEENPANVEPQILSDPPSQVRLGDNLLYIAVAFDQNGDPITFELDQAPDGMTVSDKGLIQWQPGPSQLGDNEVRLIVSDGRGGTAIQEFTIEVKTQPVNFPPSITSIPLQTAVVDVPYRFDVDANDPNNDTLIWTLENGPRGMSIDQMTGEVNWVPALADLGQHEVTIQVMDTFGASSQLVYSLTVRAVNTPPVILSPPRTIGAVGRTYLYQLAADDADGDQLIFDLVSGPDGMLVDQNTGLVQWTPVLGQEGSQDVVLRVRDSAGAAITQSYTIEVATGQPNNLPVIQSTPGFFATVDETYTYDVDATDPDGDDLSYQLRSAPDGMTIDETTGLVTWTPTDSDLGTTIVELIARDPGGAGSIQQFSLTVLEANNVPVITSTPNTSATAGEAYRYDVLANDPDGETLIYELTSGPDGLVIDGLGRMFWRPTTDQIGTQSVTVTVADVRGGIATQSFDIEVEADSEAPRVVILLGDNPVNVGDTVDVRVQAIDNVNVDELILTVDGVAVALDANNSARINTSTVGVLTLVATAKDEAGNEAQNEIDLFVADPNDVEGPQIEITSPGDGEVITNVVDVVGTVNDDTLVSYRLLLRAFDSNEFIIIGEGNENVDNDVLGQLDPTLMQNGSYVLRLEAFDASGNGNVIEQSVEVAGELKLGNFRVEFSDMVIPTAGIPIEVKRIYDTLQIDEKGEFGFGWRLDYRDTNLQVNLPETGLENVGIYSAFREGVRVYLNIPGVGRQSFTFTPDYRILPGFGNNLVLAKPRFTPDPGVNSSLSVSRTGNLTVNEFGELTAGGGIPYSPLNPDFGGVLILTTKDGNTYVIDGATGKLNSVSDRNGNVTSFSENGVSYNNDAIDIVIERDVMNRIVSIEDTSGAQLRYEYNANGSLSKTIDRKGNETAYEYSAQRVNYLESVVDPLGRTQTRLEYDEFGRLMGVSADGTPTTQFEFDPEDGSVVSTRPDGTLSFVNFDEFGNLISSVNALGHREDFGYDANGNIIAKINTVGELTEYQRDDQGNLQEVTNSRGATTRYTYDSNGKVTSIIYADGSTETFSFDAKGNLESQRDELGNVTRYLYDNSGNRIETIYPNGTSKKFEYDERGILIQETDAEGNVLRFEYDQNGNRILQEALKPDGETLTVVESIEWTYDENGNLLSTGSDGKTAIDYEFDAADQIISSTDSAGNTTTYSYSSSGVLEETAFADGTSQKYEFDLNGNINGFVGRDGLRRVVVFDLAGRPTELRVFNDPDDPAVYEVEREFVIDPLQRVSQIVTNSETIEYTYEHSTLPPAVVGSNLDQSVQRTFDIRGRLTTYQKGSVLEKYTYDDANNLTKTEWQDGTTEEFEYDSLQRLVRFVDRQGVETSYVYSDAGNLVELTRAGATYENVLDAAGRVVTQIDPIGVETNYEYDSAGRLSRIEEGGNQYQIIRNDQGQVIEKINFRGQSNSFEYDSNGQVSKEQRDGETFEAAYYAHGLIQSVSSSQGVSNYTYNDQLKLSNYTDVLGASLDYQYDSLGRTTGYAIGGQNVEYVYSTDGDIETVKLNGESVAEYSYDSLGRLSRTERSNGTSETRQYNSDGRIIRIAILDSSENELSYTAYTWNDRSLISKIDESGVRQVDFEYDASGRLSSETTTEQNQTIRVEYEYDEAGNRISRHSTDAGLTEYDYNTLGQLVSRSDSSGTTTFEYDDDGNLVKKTSGNRVEEFEWNSENRLISHSVLVDGSLTEESSFEYDHNGNRIAEVDNDGTRKEYVLDQASGSPRVIATKTISPNGDEEFEFNVLAHEVVAQHRDNTTSHYYSDVHSGTRFIYDDAGNQIASQTYDAFGNVIAGNGFESDWPGYRGEQSNLQSGLLNLRHRQYDPVDGRFIQRDPYTPDSDQTDSRNRYVYTDNNPIHRIDPSGLNWISDAAVFLVESVLAVLDFLYSLAPHRLINSRFEDAAGNPTANFNGTAEGFAVDVGIGVTGFGIKLDGLGKAVGDNDVYKLDAGYSILDFGVGLSIGGGFGSSKVSVYLDKTAYDNSIEATDPTNFTGPFAHYGGGGGVAAATAGNYYIRMGDGYGTLTSSPSQLIDTEEVLNNFFIGVGLDLGAWGLSSLSFGDSTKVE